MDNPPDNTPEDPGSSGQSSGAPPSAGAERVRTPSTRWVLALAGAMLAIGVVVGAAIGPAPSPSLAVNRLLPLLPSLLGSQSKPTTTSPPAAAAQATPSAEASPATKRRRRRRLRGAGLAATAPAEAQAPAEASAPSSTAPSSSGKTKAATLAPVTKVWLIALDGAGFEEAAANASAASYIDNQALRSGTLLGGWSALDGSSLAGEAALLAEPAPQLLDTIVQPPCPEGAASAQCQPGTPGALTAANEFLQATLPTITSSAAYRENGLVVITFASVGLASATGLPSGAATATFTSQPPAGVLVISPFATAGARSSVAYDPASPKQSLEKLLRR
ncbi:MAG TPA: hypothetical protein VMB51_05465 [Solirubrobacteraceae bacterium]|nr:hypothetical protein [Solirubrobacteraceae bacterium]